MRVNIPFVGPAYEHNSLPASAQVSKNLWPEINPNGRNQVILRPTPGLTALAELEGVDRGLHEFNGTMYAVNGSSLYRVQADGTYSNLGAIAGTEKCVMADNGTRLVIVTGGQVYQYTVNEGLKPINDPDLVNPTSVAYINSQFVFDNNNGTNGQFVSSSLLTTEFDVDALDFAQAEAHPDDIIRVMTFQQVVWFFGSRTLELWYNSGEGSPPFARMPSGVRPYGLAGTHAVAKTSEFVYWLDNDRVPRRSSGADVANIGTPALGQEFAEYSRTSDCTVMTWRQDHQTFVAFTFPTADRTWVYHEPSNSWFQWSYGVDDARCRAGSMLRAYGQNYVADHTNGKVYLLDPCEFTDDGEVIQRVRVTAPIHGGLYQQPGRRVYYDTVEFMLSYDPCKTQGEERVEPFEGSATGLCGTLDDLNLGGLLPPTPMMVHTQGDAEMAVADDIDTQAVEYGDTSVVSFTAAFSTPENPGTGSVDNYTTLYLYNIKETEVGGGSRFEVYMDSDGYIQVRGRNSSGTTVLSFTIDYAGSLAGDESHLLAFICDLTDDTRRQVYLDGADITDVVTWNTYTNDTINLEGAATDSMHHEMGGKGNDPWGDYSGAGVAEDPYITGRTCGFISFDDSCSLVPQGIWDVNGFVRDPQGDFTGWYTRQPLAACTTRTLSNNGRLAFDNGRVFGSALITQDGDPYGYRALPDRAYINLNVDGNVDAESPSVIFRPLPPTPTTQEIVAPYWNQEGTFFNFATVPTASFSSIMGVSVGGADAEVVIDTPIALWFNTDVTGRKVRVVTSNWATSVKMWLCELDGTVVSSSTSQITLPAGQAYRLMIASDSGKAKLEKFDTTIQNTAPVNEAQLRAEFAAVFGASQPLSSNTSLIDPLFSVPANTIVSIPFFHKAGRRNTFTFTRFDPAGVNVSTSSVRGQFTGSSVLNSTNDPNPGAGTVPTDPQGWYYVNIRQFTPNTFTARYKLEYLTRDN